MGGELKECGCFDGPLSADDPRAVSVRCDEHFEDGPLFGYELLRRSSSGRVYESKRPRPKMAIPKGWRRR
jgi:hypothetical protein